MVKQIRVTVLVMGLMASSGSVHPVQGGFVGQLTPTVVPKDSSAVGYLNLHKRHPDADEGPNEFDSLYSSDHALERLTQVRNFLDSFRQLTDHVRGRVGQAEWQTVGNTNASMQTIGFHNIPLVIEGTILKQEYQLGQVQYELARLKRARGGISSQELARTRTEYENATKKFQIFWDTKLPTD